MKNTDKQKKTVKHFFFDQTRNQKKYNCKELASIFPSTFPLILSILGYFPTLCIIL